MQYHIESWNKEKTKSVSSSSEEEAYEPPW